MDGILTFFLALSDSQSINTSFDRLIECTSSDSDQNQLIERALRLGSLLLEAGNRSAHKCSSCITSSSGRSRLTSPSRCRSHVED
ncbi:hypothetical protein L2E82_15148 [Cichorium intybus]|uniref:Uncharacterized protein n=1 Tax=Cichorium intybus TaxID=13427 RepID=A0ACB9F1X9_CICIN|nr:hypothetical protein L2E82_15148 [Cichorium intybus]